MEAQGRFRWLFYIVSLEVHTNSSIFLPPLDVQESPKATIVLVAAKLIPAFTSLYAASENEPQLGDIAKVSGKVVLTTEGRS